MTRDQVRQLQQAMIDDGCLQGQADGVVGPKTRRAIGCAHQKGNVTGNDPNDLLRSLSLDFTVDDQRGWSSLMHGSANGGNGDGTNDANGGSGHGEMRDSSGTGHKSRTNGRPRPGTTRDSTRRDSTRTPPAS